MKNAGVRSFALLVLALALGACGESQEEKAQKAVCDARGDMAKQVDQLKGLTAATVTTDAVTQGLDAIKNDLRDVKNAQPDLSDDRRQQVEDANKAFASQVQGIAREVVTSLSAADAKSQVTDALHQLAASYEQTFAPVSCD